MITEQEENQIMAALAFWRAVAMTSSVHPSEHPACERYFGRDRYPLAAEDIDRLLALPLPYRKNEFIPLPDAVAGTKITIDRLRQWLRRAGAKTTRFGCGRYFRTEDVAVQMAALLVREGEFKRRYNLDNIPDPTS